MINTKHVDIRNDKRIAFCSPTTYKNLAGKTIKYTEIKGIFMDVPEYLLSDLKDNLDEKPNLKKTKLIKQDTDDDNDEDTTDKSKVK